MIFGINLRNIYPHFGDPLIKTHFLTLCSLKKNTHLFYLLFWFSFLLPKILSLHLQDFIYRFFSFFSLFKIPMKRGLDFLCNFSFAFFTDFTFLLEWIRQISLFLFFCESLGRCSSSRGGRFFKRSLHWYFIFPVKWISIFLRRNSIFKTSLKRGLFSFPNILKQKNCVK